ncbi:hypothetical protein [Dactylosporangium sp. NPDC051484]|uniref:hypothetical protein n=1 Tax=Dactylosporangium sp. NPDC051484 TaxID=3154942 RepID=UPI00344E6FA8
MATFIEWLATQTDRKDSVGDLARNVQDMSDDASDLRTAGDLRLWLDRLGVAPATYHGLYDARDEFEAQIADGLSKDERNSLRRYLKKTRHSRDHLERSIVYRGPLRVVLEHIREDRRRLDRWGERLQDLSDTPGTQAFWAHVDTEERVHDKAWRRFGQAVATYLLGEDPVVGVAGSLSDAFPIEPDNQS